MAKYTFQELESKIQKRIAQLSAEGVFGKNKKLTIVDGFVSLPVQADVGENIALGRTLPCVVVIDVETGQTYTFALSYLVPGVEF